MNGLTLHPMKEIRIIIPGEHLSFATELLDNVKATGYTIIHNISGKGHHGFHTAHPMFNETESLVMLMTPALGLFYGGILRIGWRGNSHGTAREQRRNANRAGALDHELAL